MLAMESIFRVHLLLAVVYACTDAYVPRFFLGRTREGFVRPPDLRSLNKAQLMELINNPPIAEWFEQKLDHFNPADTRTWKQKYFEAGPESSDTLFVMIGGEAAISEGWMVSGMWTKYALTHDAVRLQLEHRYYGESHPTSNASVKNLRYLSSGQALSDLAHFISAKKKEFDASKVFVVGGSYAGNLAAWFRLKYPHLADGALASSAPVLAQVDFKGYLEVVAHSLNTFTPVNACNNAISAAVQSMEGKLKTPGGRKELKERFNLCDDIDIGVKEDIANLYQLLAYNFMQVVQNNNMVEGYPNIRRVCETMTNKRLGDELERYAQVNRLIQAGQCLNFKYSNLIGYLKEEDWSSESLHTGYKQWTYQTCTEFGFYHSSDSNSQPFGHGFPIEFATMICSDVFGSKFDLRFISGAVNATNVNYGARHYTEDHVVFTNGDIDPWHYLGFTHNMPKAPVIYINGTAHCADMYDPREGNPPGLDTARRDIARFIAQWLQ